MESEINQKKSTTTLYNQLELQIYQTVGQNTRDTTSQLIIKYVQVYGPVIVTNRYDTYNSILAIRNSSNTSMLEEDYTIEKDDEIKLKEILIIEKIFGQIEDDAAMLVDDDKNNNFEQCLELEETMLVVNETEIKDSIRSQEDNQNDSNLK
jgi:L-2-hydroxyglutarate oxidase LhgO